MKKTLVSVILMVLAWAAAFTGPAGAAMTDGDFIALCERGTPQEIEAAIRGGANVNAKDSGGLTALILAAEYNSDPEVVRALLQAGADVNAKNPGSVTALMAAGENNPEVVRALLWGGADVNAQSVTGTTALMIAALKNNDPAVINALLEGGADAELRDAYGKTAADYAQSNEALAGSDVLRRLEIQANENSGETEDNFIALCATGTLQEIEAAIQGGADVNAKLDSEGATALMLAAEYNSDPEVIRVLLQGGSDVNAKNSRSVTALMIAAACNTPAVINALLEGGADVELRDAYGKTAADYAQSNEALAGSDVLRRLRDFK